MKRTTEEIRELLERWYDALSTPEEERELREWFGSVQEVPADMESARRMFGGFAELATETTQPRPLRGQKGRRWSLGGRVAFWSAAAAMVLGVVFAAEYYYRPYGYINGKPVRDAETAMQTMAYLDQLSEFDRTVESFDGMMDQTEK